MAKTCIECSKRKGILNLNYAGFSVIDHASHSYPNRISPTVLPYDSDREYLCSECANKKTIVCSVHGEVWSSRFTLGRSPRCEQCSDEAQIGTSTSIPTLLEFLSSERHDAVKEAAAVRLVEISKDSGCFDRTNRGPAERVVQLCLPLLESRSVVAAQAAMWLLSHNGVIRRSFFGEVALRFLDLASNATASQSMRQSAIDGLMEITGVNAMAAFTAAKGPNPSQEELFSRLATYWVGEMHTQAYGPVATGASAASNPPGDESTDAKIARLESELLELRIDRAVLEYSSWSLPLMLAEKMDTHVPIFESVTAIKGVSRLLECLSRLLSVRLSGQNPLPDQLAAVLRLFVDPNAVHAFPRETVPALQDPSSAKLRQQTDASFPTPAQSYKLRQEELFDGAAMGVRRVVDGVVCIECPKCGTDFNRKLVLDEIRIQSPFVFEFAHWSTGFVCQVCRTKIRISKSPDD